MPELPEVETVRRGLERLVIGKQVTRVEHDNPKSFPNPPSEVEEFLIGAKVTAVKRRAKVLMIDLDSKYTLVIHLKMTGQLVFVNEDSEDGRWKMEDGGTDSNKKQPNSNSHIPIAESEGRFGAGHPSDSLVGQLPDRSTRVVIEFTDGSHLYFNDQRKFGWMRLLPTISVPEIDFMKRVGPEPLEDSFTAKDFTERFKRRSKTTIKAALLDQTVVAGVGNIYADESLWGAKIHPATKVADVPNSKFYILYSELRSVMNLAIEKGGSTDRNYVNAEGKKGSYIDFARVFRREGLPCQRHPDVLIEKSRVAGRGTHTCPACQVLAGST